MDLTPKRTADSATEMVQVVLPNDANPLGFILGGTVMHLIKVGDLILLKAHVTCVFETSLEVQVDVYSEETLTGRRQLTSSAFLTFVAIARDGARVRVPPLIVETEDERRVCE